MGTEEQWVKTNRGYGGTEEQWVHRNRGTRKYRGTVGKEEQWVQRNSGYFGEIPTLTPMYKFSCARCASGMIMQITHGKSITWTTFNSRTE